MAPRDDFVRPQFKSIHFLTCEAAAAIDWASIPVWHRHVDLGGATTRRALHDAVSEAFELPSYSGDNWDALHDSLGGLEWLEPLGDDVGYVLTVAGCEDLWAEAPLVAGTFVEIWQTAAGEWADDPQPWDPVSRSLHLVWCLNDGDPVGQPPSLR